MIEEEDRPRRVHFFGVNDLATRWYMPRVAELAAQFDPADAPTEVTDVLELHNVQRYLEHELLPSQYTDSERAEAKSKISQIRSVVAKFFSTIDEVNCASRIREINHDYYADLLDLLGRHKAYERCSATTMLQVLSETGVRLGELLAHKRLVTAYDAETRELLIASPVNAEHLIRKHLQNDARAEVHLPASLSRADIRDLLERYVDSPDPNPNYVGLVEFAPINPATGVDAKLKLRAKRRNAEITAKFFENDSGFKTGTEVSISEEQEEPAKCEVDDSDGLSVRYTYGRRWLDETSDNASILNNFLHLFEFADRNVLLTLPSYSSQLGVIERLMGTPGKTHYQVGAAFRSIDMSSLLQVRLYEDDLKSQGRNLEDIISWFFEKYLVKEFGAANFSFRPSSSGATYLERVRHLFAEMESIATQFSLWVENGEVDRDLLAMTSDQVRYKQVPSLLRGKYVYPTDSSEVLGVLNALFSDQSTLIYIDETRQGRDLADLLVNNEVSYDNFHNFQKPWIDQLIAFGILDITGERVQIANIAQFIVLRSLNETEASSYFHLSARGRAEADAMEQRGWVIRRSSLLTEAEGKYFNYYLNKAEFSNGPELRNKYLHGAQLNGEGEGAHHHAYLTALRLVIALVIKMNDDFCLSAAERAMSADQT